MCAVRTDSTAHSAFRTFELPNAKVATILLCALFAYDVFWVYLSPYAVRAVVHSPL